MKEKRDMELYRIYRSTLKSILDERGYVSTVEALEIARSSPCSCFFVGYDRAYNILLRIEKHNHWTYSPKSSYRPSNPLLYMRDNARAMFLDLYIVYERLRHENPDDTHLSSVIKACDSPARQFYLAYDTARKIVKAVERNLNKNNKPCNIQN